MNDIIQDIMVDDMAKLRDEIKRLEDYKAECAVAFKIMEHVHAEKNEEIRLLSEQVNAANQELLKRDQTNEYLASTIRQWEQVCQEQAVQLERNKREITRLREALRRLHNEAAALVYLDEPLLRQTFGNTNMSIVILRLEEAKQILNEKQELTQEPT